MIADRPTLADGLFSSDTSTYIRLAVRSAICVYLIYRLATATKPRRRALLPVYVPVLMAIAPILVFYAVRLGLVHVDAGALSKLSWLGTIGIGALPYGFLLSVVVSTFFAATALKLIVSRLVESPSAAQLRDDAGRSHSMIRRSSSGSVSSGEAALSTRAACLLLPRLRPASRRLRSRRTARPWP